MNIGIMAVDSKYPNLALMKISAYHKRNGDVIEQYSPFGNYDRVYMSKIFSFTPDYKYYINNADEVFKGGTGYDNTTVLPAEIDRLQPDYDLYGIDKDTAYGFLTRGCPNKCKWCIVPQKEGAIKPYMDIEEIAPPDKDKVILMDNNVLAIDYGLKQIEKIIKLNKRIDFNQAIDARLITDDVAQMLARVKWLKYIRFGCDTPRQIGEVERAVQLLDKHGYKKDYFLYCILQDFKESFERVNHWKDKGHRFKPFCQPYRDFNNPAQKIPQWQKDLAHWANKRSVYMSCDFADFTPRKGFVCKTYFNDIR